MLRVVCVDGLSMIWRSCKVRLVVEYNSSISGICSSRLVCYSSAKILAHRGVVWFRTNCSSDTKGGGGGESCSVLRDEHMRVSCVQRVDQSPCCHDSLRPHIVLKTFVVVLFFFLLFISLSQYLFACVHERKFYGIQNVYFNFGCLERFLLQGLRRLAQHTYISRSSYLSPKPWRLWTAGARKE